MPAESVIIGQRLWDEITKALSLNMTHRLLPVIREAYGKEYPPHTPIQLLSTVHSTYLDNPSRKLSSKLMDISVLVGETGRIDRLRGKTYSYLAVRSGGGHSDTVGMQ